MLADRSALAVLSVGVMLSTITAVVFANQPSSELAAVGRFAHLVSIGMAVSLLYLVAGAGILVYVFVCAALFIFGLFGTRMPYEAALCILFLGVGSVIGSTRRRMAAGAVIALTIISGVVMFLQLVGVGGWTQILTTHGIMRDGSSIPKEAFPTLFRGVGELEGNFLQGRPAGLLHSNQFASLVILFALALSIGDRGQRTWAIDAALCITAVLTLAKVVFLGLALLLSYQLAFGGREGRAVAFRFGMLTVGAIAIYALLFPGVFQTYLFNWPTIFQSVATR